MNPSAYVGGKDVSRMRQAMIARKSDITKSGGLKKALWSGFIDSSIYYSHMYVSSTLYYFPKMLDKKFKSK